MPHELAKQYRPQDVETEIAKRWDSARAFHAIPDAAGAPYSIVIPPPNVTAALHMGHALNNTLQDILIRYHRMLGDNAMWMPGTDHAGIATQTVVEKRVLQEEGRKRTDFTRDQFIARIQKWKDEYEKRITDQLKVMGCSCDWERQRFTMDDQCAKAVREAFFQLFRGGLIYRGKRLVNWDPITQTALADDEVEMEEIDGNFYYMRYPLAEADSSAVDPPYVTVATTRPETMLGDTAVAVNPKDTARAALIGKHVILPIVNRRIPIIGDDYVVIPNPDSDDPKAKYASGFLKVTPAHDPNDYDIGKRHNLPIVNVMAPDASISNQHGWDDSSEECQPLLGLSREDARKWIVRWFKDHGLMEEIRPYRHAVGHSYRSHAAIEPYLSDQWYVKVTDPKLAGAALQAMNPKQRSDAPASDTSAISNQTSDILTFTPERYAKTFEQWHRNIRDWCISRQLWWGHRIPVWSRVGEPAESYRAGEQSSFVSQLNQWDNEGRIARGAGRLMTGGETASVDPGTFVCVHYENDDEVIAVLEKAGYTQDPDVLDTWFSSALWPLSTLGWPDDTAELKTWNPTNVLCTAREIITLWVSRMVMFNLYFRGQLPFRDVFIHAMIQDGHGQKMSKSLGNGVDPVDIIHSHGSDAMRFTLAQMTTHTQDVRLPVECVAPASGEPFEPKYKTLSNGYKVAQPIQEHKGEKMVSSYGVASGEATPTKDMPAARNTSEKFDYGRNFANKLWNATRFALSKLNTNPTPDTRYPIPALPDRWILSRIAQITEQTTRSLDAYDFHNYADDLYHFIWGDVCDWYIEAIKPTVETNSIQQRVLASVLDVSLRLLHPAMPFVTERLYEALNDIYPQRGVEGLALPAGELLVKAAWPRVDVTLRDEAAEQQFEQLRELVNMIREARTQSSLPPRQTFDVTIKTAAAVQEFQGLIEALANVKLIDVGPEAAKPADAVTAVRAIGEIYLHHAADTEAERQRLEKRLAELDKCIAAFRVRLNNKGYVDKAPAHLVQQTRDELARVEAERARVLEQLGAK
ncbi:MAG: valine--tRNA ligase [Phycisphaeraceae bacterium]|nr:valine--tRNA ligase [Phycisphaeraceae bacterium]